MSHRSIFTIVLLALLVRSVSPASATDRTGEPAEPGTPATTEEIVSDHDVTDNSDAEEDSSDEGEDAWYEQIVVTASRTDRKAKDIPLHTTLMPREDVVSAPESAISDIVRQIPSLNLHGDQSSIAANHRDQSLNFRGVSGSAVSHGLLLVDGLPLLDPYNAAANWTKVAKDWVDRVEVVSGGGANMWGNLALSGVVNLITLPPSDRRFTAMARGGSKNTQNLSASYSDIAGSWAGWLGVDYFDTDGFDTVAEENRGLIDEPEWKQYQSLTGRGSYTASPNTVVHIAGLAYSEERGGGTPLKRSTNDEYSLSGTLDHLGDNGGSWQLRLFGRDLFHDDVGSSDASDRNSQVPRYHIFDLSSPAAGLSGVWTLPTRTKHSLTTGADAVASSITRLEDLNWDGEQFTQRSDIKGKQRLAGVFLEDRISLSEKWGLQLAGRFDVIRTYDGQSVRTDLETGEVVQSDVIEANTDSTFNPNLGFVYAASPSSRFRGAAYSGFRAPTPAELFVQSANRSDRVSVPNPALQPETLIGAEIGYDYTPSGKANVRLTGFWSQTQDLIQQLIVGQARPEGGLVEPCGLLGPDVRCRQRRNVGATEAFGAELSGEYRPSPSWLLGASANLMESEVTENPDDPDLVGNRLPATPEERVLLSASYFNPRLFDTFLRYRYVGDKFDDAENENYLPSYQVVDINLSRSIGSHWSLFGGVENVLDDTFAVSFDTRTGLVLGAPRLFHIGFRYLTR